jgi:pantoate--beta-alanine ligase
MPLAVHAAIEPLRAQVAAWKREGLRVGFVPTMGNLHAGHHSLVQLARRHADRVVASVFVNPTQFGPNEDFDRYPRTPEADIAGLAAAGCDALLLPSVEAMYPYGPAGCVQVRVPGLTEVLDGAARPGHFDGVCTVVLRLLQMVQPDAAVFGRKDFQQLQVVRYLVRDLALPVAIVPGPTLRDADGLAMSSRNQYLSAAERALAPEIHRTLRDMAEGARGGARLAELEDAARGRLAALGFLVDYAEFRRGADLARPASAQEPGLVVLAAAKLGRTRLIDNLDVDGGDAA